jgi:hypothetical protein
MSFAENNSPTTGVFSTTTDTRRTGAFTLENSFLDLPSASAVVPAPSAGAAWEAAVGQTPLVLQRIGTSQTIDEQIFDRLVALKVLASQFAMHLAKDQQSRLFDELDYLLAVDGWDAEDALLDIRSFRSFLRWIIYAKFFSWESLGISNKGTVLAAWQSERTLMTADFVEGERVIWTVKHRSDVDPEGEYAAGDSSLKSFARQTDFYFGG